MADGHSPPQMGGAQGWYTQYMHIPSQHSVAASCACRAGIGRSRIEVCFQEVSMEATVHVGDAGLPNFKYATLGLSEVSALSPVLQHAICTG